MYDLNQRANRKGLLHFATAPMKFVTFMGVLQTILQHALLSLAVNE